MKNRLFPENLEDGVTSLVALTFQWKVAALCRVPAKSFWLPGERQRNHFN